MELLKNLNNHRTEKVQNHPIEDKTMQAIVALVKPVLFALLTSKAVKDLVIQLLYKYVKTTDNQIDDTLVRIVEEKLFTAQ